MSVVSAQRLPVGSDAMTLLSFCVGNGKTGECLRRALADCEEEVGLSTVARQTLFLSPEADRAVVERVVKEAYKAALPATTCVLQPPADGHAVAAELWAFSQGAEVCRPGHVSRVTVNGVQWTFVGGLESGEGESLRLGLHRVLREARREFERAGSDFARIVRTWYYVGGILEPTNGGIRYGEANRARNELYGHIWPDLRFSPASTGIGADGVRAVFEGLALTGPEGAFETTWLDNPLQTPPCLYEIDTDWCRRPAFSRAAGVRFGNATVVFISGTASIRESQVVDLGDAAAQTDTTIENIETLIGEDNLVGNYGFARGAGLADVLQYRVYVKSAGDLESVRERCERRLPPVPRTYMIADVCRPECLVEIEGVAGFTA